MEEQQVPIATTTVHYWQYCTNQDSVTPIHEVIHELEGQGMVSKACSPFSSPMWSVHKSVGDWALTVDYCGQNTIPECCRTGPAGTSVWTGAQGSRVVPSSTWLMHFSPFLWQQNASLSLLSPGGAYRIPGTHCPRGGNTAPPSALEWSRLHWERVRLQSTCSTDDITVWSTELRKILRKGRR